MYTDAWKETFERAELQGKPVLFTPNRVLPDTVPEKWFRYELRGRGRDFEVPRYLEKEVAVDFLGTVLSPERFALNHGRLNIEGEFERLYEPMTVSGFCRTQSLPLPKDTKISWSSGPAERLSSTKTLAFGWSSRYSRRAWPAQAKLPERAPVIVTAKTVSAPPKASSHSEALGHEVPDFPPYSASSRSILSVSRPGIRV